MPSLLTSNTTRPIRKPPRTTYLALVVLAAAGAGVIARYHSGQKKPIVVQPWETPGTGGVRIVSGASQQGTFDLRLGAAMSTPMGYWPGVFLSIRYSDSKNGALTGMHYALFNSFRLGPPNGRPRPVTGDIVTHYITATVQPFDRHLTPCGERTPISFRPVFGPDAPLAGALPTTYSANTAELVIDVIDNSDRTNHGQWVVANLPPANELVSETVPKVSTQQLGNVRIEGRALEMPDTQSSALVGSPGSFQGSSFSPLAYTGDFHYQTGLPAIECLLHATASHAKRGEWRLIIDRLLPQWAVQSPRMRGMTDPLSVTNTVRTYELQVGPGSTIDNSFLIYCCPGYGHQQKVILVGGDLVRQTSRDSTVTLRNVDLVYNANAHFYEAQWSRYEPQSVSGVMLFPINHRRGVRLPPTPDDRQDAAEFRVAYRYAYYDHSGHPIRPENLPDAALIDPFNRNADGTPALHRIPPPFFSEVANGGTPFDDWYDVYIPGKSASTQVHGADKFAPGVRELLHQHCGGVIFRVSLPHALAARHRKIHLDEVKFVVTSRSVTENHPFTLVLPVTVGSSRDWNVAMRAAAQRPSDLSTAMPHR